MLPFFSIRVRGLTVICFLLAWLVLLAGTAYASDCPPDDPSRSDCKAAATTARNPLVPIAGGVAGGVAGEVIGRVIRGGRRDKTEKGEEAQAGDPESPCLEVLERFQFAKIETELLLEAFVRWQNTIRELDELYWKTSEAGYWGAVVDIGFLAGSVIGRPLAGLSRTLGRKYLGDTLKQKLLEVALKSVLKGSLKDVGKVFDLAQLPEGQAPGLVEKYLQEVIEKEVTSRIMQDYLNRGLRAGAFDGATVKFFGRLDAYEKIREVVSKSYAEPVSNFLGDILSLYSAGMDALTAREQLEIIRMKLNAARDNLFITQDLLDEATHRVSLARDSYNRCTQGEFYQRYLRRLQFLRLP